MAVTATTVAAATTMLAAVAAVFLTLVLCFYIFLCAKRYGVGPPPAGQRGVGPWLRAVFFSGTGGGAAADESAAAAWCYDGGLDEKSMAKLPRREVGEGEAALDCAVCIAEVAAGETARVLPRCGHAFHVDCVDMWLRSHSTCPLCRCPAVDDPPLPPAVPTPEADPESPNFPTNVLFFGSQDDVSTGGGAQPQAQTLQQAPPQQQQQQGGLRRLIGCGGASPPPQPPQQNCSSQRRHQEDMDADGDLEMGLGESSASRPVKPAQPGS